MVTQISQVDLMWVTWLILVDWKVFRSSLYRKRIHSYSHNQKMIWVNSKPFPNF